MADLTVERNELTTGTAIAANAVSANAGGDRFNPGSNAPCFLYVANGHTSSQSVIIGDANSQSPEGATAFNAAVTIPVANATNKVIPIRNPARFRDANGWINLTYSGVTALTVKPFS